MSDFHPDPKSVALAFRSHRRWQVGVKVETTIKCDHCGVQIAPHTFYWRHPLGVRACDACFYASTEALERLP